MKLQRILLAALIATGLLCSTVARASLVEWDLTGVGIGADPTFPATFAAPGVTGLDITRYLVKPNAADNSFNSTGWVDASHNLVGGYVQLGFDLTGVAQFVNTFQFATRSSATGPGLMDVNVSIDGGAFQTISQIVQPSATYVDLVLDIDKVVHNSLAVQFAADNNTAANGGLIGTSGTWRITDYYDGTYHPVAFTGMATPEPSTFVVFGLALGGLGVVTRLRHRSAAR